MEQILGQDDVVLTNYFPDRKKFIKSVEHTTTGENLGVLSPTRRFRLGIWASEAGFKEVNEAGSGNPPTSNFSEQPEELYTTEQLNCFLDLTKGNRNVLLTNYFSGREKK